MKLLALALLATAVLPADLDELAKKARDPQENTRMKAVEELAALDVPEAWELVLAALEDGSARVADRAQLELGRTARTEVVEELRGKRGVGSRDEEIRGRALEALGRSPVEIPAETFVKALGDKSEDVRFRAAWSVERCALGGHLGADAGGKLAKALEKARDRDKSPDVRAAALSALAAAEPTRARELVEEGLTSSLSFVVVAALQAAAALEDVGYAERCGRVGLASQHRAVRRAAVDLCGRLATRAAVGHLIERLAVEQDLRVTWSIVERLQALSGRKHGRDPRPWRDWLESLEEGWTPGERSKDRDYGETSAAFVGLPVLSANVAFLVDFSGSTWEEREGGATRKSKLDVELRRALESLPEDTRFNVMPYTDDPFPWEKELVEASERNVKRALEYFENCKQSGKGDFLSAALLALEDPAVDTIMVLTDGAPTGCKHWNLELLVPWVAQRARYRQVAVDSLLVDASGFLSRFWRDLAERTGGRSIGVALE